MGWGWGCGLSIISSPYHLLILITLEVPIRACLYNTRLDLILSSLYELVGQVARLPPPIHAPPKHTRTGWPLKAIIRYLKGTADQGLMSRQPEIFNSIYIYNIYVDARLCVTISRQITIIIYPTESLRRKEIFQNRIAALEVRLGTPLVLSKPPDRRGGSTPQ